MILIKLCRKCKKFNISHNDNTAKDKLKYNALVLNKMVCGC